jgi:hypothetical protein
MLNPNWVEREEPLAMCPLAACRRNGICHHTTDRSPCRRLHEPRDDVYDRISAKIDVLLAEARIRDPEGRNRVPEGSPEFELRLKHLYDMVRAADIAQTAREMAAAKKAKPARIREDA